MTMTEQIQRALRNPLFTYRTIKGLSEETGMDTEDVKIYLDILEGRGDVMFAYIEGQEYWTIHLDYENARRIEEARKYGEHRKEEYR